MSERSYFFEKFFHIFIEVKMVQSYIVMLCFFSQQKREPTPSPTTSKG